MHEPWPNILFQSKKYCLIELSLKSPCLWALVWPLKSLFHPQFECSHKVNVVWYNLLKLSISSQGLQDFMLTRFEWMKNMNNNESVSKANPQLGVKLLCKSNWCKKTSLVFYFFPSCTIFILIFYFVSYLGKNGF